MTNWVSFGLICISVGILFNCAGDLNHHLRLKAEHERICVLSERVHDLLGRVQRLEGVDIRKAVKIGPPEQAQ
jgi:hypothetical protein